MNTPPSFRSMGRREFLRAGSLPLVGLGLPQLLAAKPLPTKRAKACIVLFMWGGPAHQDTWDMKPDSPSGYRGEFKPIATNVPGLQVCEHLPRIARHADKLGRPTTLCEGKPIQAVLR